MPLKFALYPGCAAKGATPELYQSTMAIVGRLGIEVVELAASSCCGAGVIGEADPDVALALNARTFAQAERLGLDIMTICGTCQGVMSAANRRLKNEPGTLERVNTILAQDGISYGGGVQFGLITDSTLCPDPEHIIERFAPEFEKLLMTMLMLPWGEQD